MDFADMEAALREAAQTKRLLKELVAARDDAQRRVDWAAEARNAALERVDALVRSSLETLEKEQEA